MYLFLLFKEVAHGQAIEYVFVHVHQLTVRRFSVETTAYSLTNAQSDLNPICSKSSSI